MKENIYKFLKFLNRNKYIVGVVLFISFLFLAKNTYAACGFLDVGCYLNEGVGSIFISIALFFISFAAWVFGLLFPIFLNITGWLLNSGPINTAWILIRDFVNMFFIFFLLFASLAKLVGKEKILKQGSATKQVIYILLSAFLINFSKVICGVVVDITQIITLQFTNAFVDSLANLGSIFNVTKEGTTPTPSILLGVIFIVFALAFLATAMSAILYILIRAISLGIYASLSPLWFLWLSFPTKSKQVEQIKSETMDKFFQAAMGGPILAFYLWISLMLIAPGSDSVMDTVNQAGAGAKPMTVGGGGTEVEGASKAAADIDSALIMRMVVATVVMLFAQQQAMSMAKKAGTVMGKGLMDGVVNKVGAVGMKPLDGLKNAAQNTAKNVGNSISNTAGKIGDTAMGGIRNGMGMARGGNNIASKMLDRGLKMKEGMSANAINNAKMVSQRNSENKALQDAIKKGDPAAIAKAREAVNKRQIEQGKKVAADARNAGGWKNYAVGGVKKYGAAAAATGLAIATGGASLGLTAVGAAGYGATKFTKGAINAKSDAEKKIDELKETRKNMAANPQKYTKDDISRVTAQIGEQEAIAKKEKERQKLSEDRKELGVARSARAELDSKKSNQEKSLAKGFVESGIQNDKQYNAYKGSKQKEIDDLNSKISQVRDPEVIAKLKSKANGIQSEIDSMDKNKKSLDKQGGFNAKIGEYLGNATRIKELEEQVLPKHMTLDNVRKQQGAYAKADGGISKASKAVEDARVKAAGIEDKKEDSNDLKRYKDSQDGLKSKYVNDAQEFQKNSIDTMSAFYKESAKKGKAELNTSLDNYMAMIALKLKEGASFTPEEVEFFKKKQQDIQKALRNKENDFIKEWNDALGKGFKGVGEASDHSVNADEFKGNIREVKKVEDLNASSHSDYSASARQERAISEAIAKIASANNVPSDNSKLEQVIKNTLGSKGLGYSFNEEELKKVVGTIKEGLVSANKEAIEKQMAGNFRGEDPSKANDAESRIANDRQINIHPDSFNSLKKTIKGSLRDLDSSISSKLDKLVDSIGSISESDISGKPGRVSMDESSITQLASVLGESMNPGQFNSLVDSIHGLAKSDEKSADAMVDFIKALQKARSKDDSNGIS